MDKLGKGSTCLVYKAELRNRTQADAIYEYAIKVIKLKDPSIIEKIKIEIAMMKLCTHQNIVKYVETYKYMK